MKYIIHLNVIVAVSAGLLAAGVANIFILDNYVYYGLFCFFSTLCVYNGQRLFKTETAVKTPWLEWVNKHKKLVGYTSIFSGLIAGYIFLKLLTNITPSIISLFGLAIAVSIFYVVRIKGNNIRELPYLKIHSIALIWTLIIIVFPIINEQIYNWKKLIIFSFTHYIYFIAVTIPFDIRDLKFDSPTQRTIPQIVGVKKAKIISVLLLILTTINIAILSNLLLTPLFILAILTQIVLVVSTTEKHQQFYFSTFIDGAIALLGLSYLTINNDFLKLWVQ